MNKQGGQTIIALLIFMLLVISLAGVAATITIVNIRSNNAVSAGQQALANAESGAEDALQHLLRDPNYSGGAVSFANGTATISISGMTVKTIIAVGQYDNNRRTVTVTVDNTLTPTSWSETP